MELPRDVDENDETQWDCSPETTHIDNPSDTEGHLLGSAADVPATDPLSVCIALIKGETCTLVSLYGPICLHMCTYYT
jgi:hypothetical protein